MRNLKFVQFGDFAILHAAQPLKLQPESEQALILCPFILSLSLPKHTHRHRDRAPQFAKFQQTHTHIQREESLSYANELSLYRKKKCCCVPPKHKIRKRAHKMAIVVADLGVHTVYSECYKALYPPSTPPSLRSRVKMHFGAPHWLRRLPRLRLRRWH